MAQSTFSIRMDEGLKRDFNQFCDDVGMTMTAAFVVFAKAAVRERRFPFEIGEHRVRLPRTRSDDSAARARQAFAALRAEAARREGSEMTLDEINAEIAAARAERRLREQRHPA